MSVLRSTAIAIVSLVPDPGHVIPLLRIGAALRRAGATVVAFLPDSCAALGAQYGVELRSGGPRVSARTKQLASRFGHSYAGRAWIPRALLRYFAAVRRDASRALGGLRAALDELRPDLLLADPHGLADWVRYLARACGAVLIFHESEGTLRRWQPLPVQLRGLAPLPPGEAVIHRGLAYLERTAARAVERSLRWAGGPDWQEHPETLGNIAAALGLTERSPEREAALRSFRAAPITLPPVPTVPTVPTMPTVPTKPPKPTGPGDAVAAPLVELVITTGIAPLELGEARPGLVVPEGVTRIGPLRGAASDLPVELARWISDGDRVVYLSFGTMLRVDRALSRAMGEALAALRLRGLWAIPPSRAGALSGAAVPAHLRVEPHVPQLAVLQRPEVVCCVTHAGAGTVQESLWAGKPMLCVPALWDQFYNASWVERRGAGLRMAPHRATAATLRRALAALVQEPSYTAAARALGRAFEAARGEERVVEIVEGVVRARRAPATGARPPIDSGGAV